MLRPTFVTMGIEPDLRHYTRRDVTEQCREPEHAITRQLKSKPSVRAQLRQALCGKGST
jgi:hypothetical protein